VLGAASCSEQNARSVPTLIIHVIRTNIVLPFSPLRDYLGFSTLPLLCWPLLALTVVGDVVLTQAAKMVLLRRGWI
jgi:Mg2+-importing ATPase